MQNHFDATLAFAQQKDKEDVLKHFRSEFYFPQHSGNDAIYLCGNSLGLQPKNVNAAIQQELEDWQQIAKNRMVILQCKKSLALLSA